MLFKPELALQIALGNKPQTRRPKKQGETLEIVDGVKRVLTASGRVKHAVGSIRAIPYGRGKPTRWWNPGTCQLLEWDSYKEAVILYGKDKLADRLSAEGWAPFKYEILDIHEVADVRDISHEDSVAEGFDKRYGAKYRFLYTWMMMYDATFAYRIDETEYDSALPDHCPLWLWSRPDYKYQNVWKYTFKVHVEETS